MTQGGRWMGDGAAAKESLKGRQLTFVEDRDVCFLFLFSLDDRYLLYLRETQHASETNNRY